MLTSLTAVLAAALVAAGCGGEPTSSRSGLVDALAKVRATADTTTYVEFGAPNRVPDGDRFQPLAGYGYAQVAQMAERIREKLGLDLTEFDAGVLAGQPPRWVGAVWGEYDTAAVEGKLTELGVTREGEKSAATRWRGGEDDEIDLEGGPLAEVVRLNQFNTLRTADGSFAYAPAAAGLDWVAAPGENTLADSLADHEAIGPLARCLGDVVAAVLTDAGHAVGVRADGTEVICVDASTATVERALEGAVPSTQEPWDELLPGAQVDESAGRTRVTVPAPDSADRPVGRVMRLMTSRDVRALDG